MIEINISDRIVQDVVDGLWGDLWYNVITELEESVGPFKSAGEYPIISEGFGWVIRAGFPQEQQQYYVAILDEKLATGYILKYVKNMELVTK